MKKIYKKPIVKSAFIEGEAPLLAESTITTRDVPKTIDEEGVERGDDNDEWKF